MKSTLKLVAMAALMVGAASLASASPFTFAVSPTQTFGTPVFAGGTTSPNVISLATLGTDIGAVLTPGSAINFAAVGEACYNPLVTGCTSGSSSLETPVGSFVHTPIEGFFVGSSSAPSGSGASNLSPTGLNLWTANITGMFDITAGGTGNIIIPVGSTGVEFAFVDSFYGDNSDFSGTLGVVANAPAVGPVPEPATYGMMIAGLGALLAFKRVRRS